MSLIFLPPGNREVDALAQGHTAWKEWSLTLNSGHLPPEPVLLANLHTWLGNLALQRGLGHLAESLKPQSHQVREESSAPTGGGEALC